MGGTPAQLEKHAWGLLGDLCKIATVGQFLLQIKKYSGILVNYSGFNSLPIGMQDLGSTIVRSKNE
jgi:hypothetical protein